MSKIVYVESSKTNATAFYCPKCGQFIKANSGLMIAARHQSHAAVIWLRSEVV